MPDHRLRGATAYSTNKSTQANRRRLSSMPSEQRAALRKKTSEYQAIWQLLNRVSRKEAYRRANRGLQRSMLQSSCSALIEKRRREGKAMCETDTETMIEKHLKKETASRSMARHAALLPGLQGVAIDPSPHAHPEEDADDLLSPPTTPENMDGDEAYINVDLEALKLETEGGPSPPGSSDFDAALDTQLKARSRSQSAHSILSSFRAEITSLREQVASLHEKIESLQQERRCGDEYSATEEGNPDGYPHPVYQLQAMGVQPMWQPQPQGMWGMDGQHQQQGQEDWATLGPQPYSERV